MATAIGELPFEAFDRVFATYWGRRSLGIVIDDTLAARISSDWRRARELHRAWGRALRDFPAETTGLRLAGTPALTPEVLELVRGVLDPNVAPPPALIGAFADPAAPASPGAVPTVPLSGAPSGFHVTEDFAARALARLRVHRPQLRAGVDGTGIRLRVSGRLWLHAAPPALAGAHWLTRPLAERGDRLVEIDHAHPYALGVNAAHSPEDVADRLYNELGYWWISCARLLAA
jgi:hypothetical protein